MLPYGVILTIHARDASDFAPEDNAADGHKGPSGDPDPFFQRVTQNAAHVLSFADFAVAKHYYFE